MFTVVGGSGFIGSHLLRHLRQEGIEAVALPRGDRSLADLGHVVYCAGVTSDFRSRPLDTIEAHVSELTQLLRNASFDSFLYLSSTRVYGSSTATEESSTLSVRPDAPSDLYNLSKLTGEAACLAMPQREVRVARISNVFGFDLDGQNFLSSLIRDAILKGRIVLRTSRGSAKDYIGVHDVVAALTDIARSGRERIYNLACGSNVSHGAIVDTLQTLTGCDVESESGAPVQRFAPIDTARLRAEFGGQTSSVLDALPELVSWYREALMEG